MRRYHKKKTSVNINLEFYFLDLESFPTYDNVESCFPPQIDKVLGAAECQTWMHRKLAILLSTIYSSFNFMIRLAIILPF